MEITNKILLNACSIYCYSTRSLISIKCKSIYLGVDYVNREMAKCFKTKTVLQFVKKTLKKPWRLEDCFVCSIVRSFATQTTLLLFAQQTTTAGEASFNAKCLQNFFFLNLGCFFKHRFKFCTIANQSWWCQQNRLATIYCP